MGCVAIAANMRGFEIPTYRKMIFIAGGSCRMGSNKDNSEEALVHRVKVSDFGIDRTPPQVAKLDFPQGHQRLLASLHAELLPPLPPGRAPRRSGGYVQKPRQH